MAYTRLTGDYLDFLYNRDNSSKNYYLSGSFTPDYGATISWDNRISEIKFLDNYSRRKPLGLNSMETSASLSFNNISKFEAGILQKTMEQVNKSEYQYITLTYDDNQIVSSGINNVFINLDYGQNSDRLFNNISGFSLKNYSSKSKENNMYDFSLELVNDSYPAYLYTDGFYTNSTVNIWDSGQSYEKYDIVKLNIFQNERDNIFYCTEDHTSSAANSPSQNSQYWTQDFFWKPNFAISVGHERKNFQKSPMGFYEKLDISKNENFSNLQIAFIIFLIKKLEVFYIFLKIEWDTKDLFLILILLLVQRKFSYLKNGK
jgi:phage-related protein